MCALVLTPKMLDFTLTFGSRYSHFWADMVFLFTSFLQTNNHDSLFNILVSASTFQFFWLFLQQIIESFLFLNTEHPAIVLPLLFQ